MKEERRDESPLRWAPFASCTGQRLSSLVSGPGQKSSLRDGPGSSLVVLSAAIFNCIEQYNFRYLILRSDFFLPALSLERGPWIN